MSLYKEIRAQALTEGHRVRTWGRMVSGSKASEELAIALIMSFRPAKL